MGRAAAQGFALSRELLGPKGVEAHGEVCEAPRGVKARPQILVAIKILTRIRHRTPTGPGHPVRAQLFSVWVGSAFCVNAYEPWHSPRRGSSFLLTHKSKRGLFGRLEHLARLAALR